MGVPANCWNEDKKAHPGESEATCSSLDPWKDRGGVLGQG